MFYYAEAMRPRVAIFLRGNNYTLYVQWRMHGKSKELGKSYLIKDSKAYFFANLTRYFTLTKL